MNRLVKFFSVLLFISFVFLIYFSFYSPPLNQLRVIFLDIGQGDAILIKTPQNKNILIDGGPDKGVIYKIDNYLSFNNRVVDLMILTHPDPDHLNGLIEVLKRFKVKKLIVNSPLDDVFSLFKKLAEEKNLIPLVAEGPSKINLGRNLDLDFFWPPQDLEESGRGDNNHFSLVFKMTFDKVSFLFTGDVDLEAENEIRKRGADLKVDVLKVSHHGSKNSSSLYFLEKTKPKYAVISCGRDNRFGHPDPRVIEDLEKIGAQIFRTDKSGDIIFETDGELIKFKNRL